MRREVRQARSGGRDRGSSSERRGHFDRNEMWTIPGSSRSDPGLRYGTASSYRSVSMRDRGRRRWCNNNAFGGHQPVSHIFREQSQFITDNPHIFCDVMAFFAPQMVQFSNLSQYTLDVASDIASNCLRPSDLCFRLCNQRRANRRSVGTRSVHADTDRWCRGRRQRDYYRINMLSNPCKKFHLQAPKLNLPHIVCQCSLSLTTK